VIAVFTKYEQFMRNVEMQLEDDQRSPALLNDEAAKVFNEHYLDKLRGPPPFVCLEGERFMNKRACIRLMSVLQKCTSLANGVLPFLKRQLTHSLAKWLPSCYYRYKRITWS
jgi:hypothetical protein